MSEVVDLAIKMIDIQSTTGDELAMADFLDTYMSAKGWKVTRQTYAPGRDNVYISQNDAKPDLILNSHIDTVPPHFAHSRDESFIYGRGACDTKSLIAAQLLAAQKLKAEGYANIALLYVVGEEVDHCGMLKANELGLDPRFIIVGEPTESKLVRRQKGLVKVRLITKGKAAHSGYPETGVSAVEPLLDALEKLRKVQWPEDDMLGQTTMNIGVLGGGKAANIVPEDAFAEVMIRVVTNEKDILDQVRETVGNLAEIRMIASNDPCELTTLEGYETIVVSFNTDIPYFKFTGKALLWGAGSIKDAHTSGEKIGIKDLEAAVDIYADLARKCLT